ncbi:MAG TPA: hypothetical protein VJ792_09505 [Candidatus Nitrosotalea sp.]|nr:hypothetical protein [Candidatus Nitrosotalea sp.]
MIFTYLILKLTLQSVLNECNRLAGEQQSKQQVMMLKSRLLKLRLDYEKGKISAEDFNNTQAEILKSLGSNV